MYKQDGKKETHSFISSIIFRVCHRSPRNSFTCELPNVAITRGSCYAVPQTDQSDTCNGAWARADWRMAAAVAGTFLGDGRGEQPLDQRELDGTERHRSGRSSNSCWAIPKGWAVRRAPPITAGDGFSFPSAPQG